MYLLSCQFDQQYSMDFRVAGDYDSINNLYFTLWAVFEDQNILYLEVKDSISCEVLRSKIK